MSNWKVYRHNAINADPFVYFEVEWHVPEQDTNVYKRKIWSSIQYNDIIKKGYHVAGRAAIILRIDHCDYCTVHKREELWE